MVTYAHLLEQAEAYLHRLCRQIGNRRLGSTGNRAATDFFAETTSSFGFSTALPSFECTDWAGENAELVASGVSFEVFPSPYSLGCSVAAPLSLAASLSDLQVGKGAGHVLLLWGELAREQLVPKNFPFYTSPEHRQILSLLEAQAPLALVTATARNPETAGAVYPFPLIEDGDVDIPSVYMTAEEGERLAVYAGHRVSLISRARRIPARACNVVARKGAMGQGIVFCAHIDAKLGTPGAIDNASGVVVLLLLAELLTGYAGRLGVEIVALNGEDYYAATGQVEYLRANRERLAEIALVVNIDGAGYRRGRTAYSLYGCPSEMAALARGAFSGRESLVEGEPWYQGDHMIFVQNGVPALAITSEHADELLAQVVHTPRDVPELVESAKLVDIALALRDLVRELSGA
ncbi:MAG: M28 family peptidase [Chloroflexi bacterium]|nr:M28 family peptidase [Chloroflexota bacterium]